MATVKTMTSRLTGGRHIMNEEVQKFLLSLIEPEVWSRAVWRGCAFLFDEGRPPIMVFLFQHKEAGQAFADLRGVHWSSRPTIASAYLHYRGRFKKNDNAYAVNVGPNCTNIHHHFGLSDDAIGERYVYHL
jgi:hypothetical protein